MRRLLVAAEVPLLAILAFTAVTYSLVYIARGLDDVAYHIPGAVRIAQHANPYFVDSPVDSHWYPAGAETLAALPIAAIGSINATNVTGGLCFVAVCLAVYAAAGLWTRDLAARLAAAVAAAGIPLLLAQCLAFYVDIHLALLAFGALGLQARGYLGRSAQPAWLALALALLLPSVKYGGLAYLLVIAPGCLFCAWRAWPPRRPGPATAALLALALAFTAGFYVRNWLERGNPLYPIGLPAWLRPVAALSPAPYEADEELLGKAATTRQSSRFPQPWLPRSWGEVRLRPDMTDDGFGASGALALLATLATLLLARRLDPGRRGAWLLLLLQVAAIVAVIPTGASGPRYVLVAPLVASLSPAVLMAVSAGSRALSAAARAFQLALVGAVWVFVGANLLGGGDEWTRLSQAAARLSPYQPHGLRAIGYAQAGHLRIGYTSGFANMIALLYDRELSNQLVPLHYRNYVFNRGPEFASAEEFVAHVRSLELDYIQIFDPNYPGADLLQQHFPEKVWRWDRAAGRAYR